MIDNSTARISCFFAHALFCCGDITPRIRSVVSRQVDRDARISRSASKIAALSIKRTSSVCRGLALTGSFLLHPAPPCPGQQRRRLASEVFFMSTLLSTGTSLPPTVFFCRRGRIGALWFIRQAGRDRLTSQPTALLL